jgi:hypothetical protein
MRTQGLGVAPACNRSLEFPQHVKPGRSCNGLRRSDPAQGAYCVGNHVNDGSVGEEGLSPYPDSRPISMLPGEQSGRLRQI